MESEYSQIENNLMLLFVLAPTWLEQIKYLAYSQYENVHFLTVGEITILTRQVASQTGIYFVPASVINKKLN